MLDTQYLVASNATSFKLFYIQYSLPQNISFYFVLLSNVKMLSNKIYFWQCKLHLNIYGE